MYRARERERERDEGKKQKEPRRRACEIRRGENLRKSLDRQTDRELRREPAFLLALALPMQTDVSLSFSSFLSFLLSDDLRVFFSHVSL